MDAVNKRAEDENRIKIVCSVIPGFETIALNECKDRCGLDAVMVVRGRIAFDINIEDIERLTDLRSVHHYQVIVGERHNFFNKPEQTKENLCDALKNLPTELNWSKALKTWKNFKLFKQNTYCKDPEVVSTKKKKNQGKDDNEIDFSIINPEHDAEKIGFRCTATRTGTHIVTSMESARYLGGGVNDFFNWRVDLNNFDLEVVVYILDAYISVGIQLTNESQSLRNITHFGPTTLKASICYCLIQLALPKAGDIICDPMCGGGSIQLEGAHSFPSLFSLGGDNHEVGVEHARENMESMISRNNKEKVKTNSTINMSIARWDVYQLPLRDACVDHVVSDLPFGKKIGNKERNLFLYPIALAEMARICRRKGKAVLLTMHKQAMKKALNQQRLWWRCLECRRINMGGMNVSVYILLRTNTVYIKKDRVAAEEKRAQHNPRDLWKKNNQDGAVVAEKVIECELDATMQQLSIV